MIQHIVMWKFREGTDPTEFLTRLAALDGVIDCIRSMKVRRSAAKNADFDAVLVAEFDTMADVEAYRTDPRHVAVAALCKDIRVSRCAIDIES